MTLYVPALVISHAHNGYGQSVRHGRTVHGQLMDNPWTSNRRSEIVVQTSRVSARFCDLYGRSVNTWRTVRASFSLSAWETLIFWLIFCINWGHCSRFEFDLTQSIFPFSFLNEKFQQISPSCCCTYLSLICVHSHP
jgi:hypothetical protein